jgi:uncharacterized membrane protein
MLVPFPIAFLSGALLTDLVFAFGGGEFWAAFSFWLIVGGIASALLAAVVGMVDFLGIGKVRKHRAGKLHLVLNVVAVVLSAVNLIVRLGDSREAAVVPLGIALSALVTLLLAVSGWYGGELSYRHKIGVMRE